MSNTPADVRALADTYRAPDLNNAECVEVLTRLLAKRTSRFGERPHTVEQRNELAALHHAISALVEAEPMPNAVPDTGSRTGARKLEWEELSPGWRPIVEEDREVSTIQTFGDVTLRNSHPSWVRDEDGRTYEAVWTVDDRQRGYWWDIEGESPVDPIEIYPHPLAQPVTKTDTAGVA